MFAWPLITKPPDRNMASGCLAGTPAASLGYNQSLLGASGTLRQTWTFSAHSASYSTLGHIATFCLWCSCKSAVPSVACWHSAVHVACREARVLQLCISGPESDQRPVWDLTKGVNPIPEWSEMSKLSANTWRCSYSLCFLEYSCPLILVTTERGCLVENHCPKAGSAATSILPDYE